MRVRALSCLAAMVVALRLAAPAGQAVAHGRASGLECDGTWQLQRNPDTPSDFSGLIDVSGTAPADVWAVGNDFSTQRALVEHWDGTRWMLVPTPPVGDSPILRGVSALSATDVWAVGDKAVGTAVKPVTEHWNGRRWTSIRTPNFGPSSSLTGVEGLSSNDVWAVGGYRDQNDQAHNFILHWDGTRWSDVPIPDVLGLVAIDGNSATDVWAVGSTGAETLIMHWDGQDWTIVPSPNPGNLNNSFTSVAAISLTDAWAVGWWGNFGGETETLIEHWGGANWTVAPSPAPGTFAQLLDISAISTSSVWAVGLQGSGAFASTLTERWDGTAWSVVPSPNLGTRTNVLQGVWTASATEAFAVGYMDVVYRGRPLTERYC